MRAVISRLVLISCSLLLLAWVPQDEDDLCPSIGWYYTFSSYADSKNIEIRLAYPWYDAIEWSSAQKNTIRLTLGMINHVTSSRMHLWLSETPCVPDQYSSDGTICLTQVPPDDFLGQATHTVGNPLTGCFIEKCKIKITTEASQYEDALNHVLLHEIGHCIGFDHHNGHNDVMDPNSPSPGGYGQDEEHLGITRDFVNGISYLYPFGHNVFVGQFDDSSSVSAENKYTTDVLVRDATREDNVVGWYLNSAASFFGSLGLLNYVDIGEVSDDGDFGDQDTLTYLVGNFDGVGLDDIAAGMCIGCDPGDGLADTIRWVVMRGDDASTNARGFISSSTWKTDFGNGEDFDQYRVGDFNGDGCDDIALIRNLSGYDCNPVGANKCYVRVYRMLAVDSNWDGVCESFGSFAYVDVEGSDRNAVVAWPWVVGDFASADGNHCDDLAFGEISQQDPSIVRWRMLRSNCNTFALDYYYWTGDLGDNGQVVWFGAHVGWASGQSTYRDADDLVRVKVKGNAVEWGSAYSNGVDGFAGWQTTVSNNWWGNDDHFGGKLLFKGVREKSETNSPYARDQQVYMCIRDDTGGGDGLSVRDCTVSITGFDSSFGTACRSWDAALPSSYAVWDQVTDWDEWNSDLDNGGDDVRGQWWCQDCAIW